MYLKLLPCFLLLLLCVPTSNAVTPTSTALITIDTLFIEDLVLEQNELDSSVIQHANLPTLIFFYPMVDGKELIEVNFVTAWNAKYGLSIEDQQMPITSEIPPKSFLPGPEIAPPYPKLSTVFLLRDSLKNILKIYNWQNPTAKQIKTLYTVYVKDLSLIHI